MFDKALKYSYAAQKKERYRILRIITVVISIYVLYNVFGAFLFSIWTLENNAMRPGMAAGDRLVFRSFALRSLLTAGRPADSDPPFERGSIVLVDTEPRGRRKAFRKIADGIVRFCTAQRLSLYGKEEYLYLKRLIGLPGDEISMKNFVFRVKPADSSYSLTEFEFSGRPYQPDIPRPPALWDESLPFSGNMEQITLGEDEYFVASDDRGNTNDSRTWGPVSTEALAAEAVFRFWPLTRIGRP
ncbi:MAG: signal peptidase I [Treponema sp.]|jgi:signal peptidase I|nr:signal peptidase I [Treponema sp.]